MTIEQATIQLAELMARKAVNTKDIHTTAEGKSALKYHYANARKMVEQAVQDYLDKV